MIRLAVLYFALVFTAGFGLGVLRTMFLVPSLGRRYAELLEIPLMLVVVFFAGRWIARQATSRIQTLKIGFLALAMLLTAEIALAAMLFGKGPTEALFKRDPVSGSAYYLALILFAIMPNWVKRGT